MQIALLVFLYCGGAKTGHKQTGTYLCLRCNSERVVFSKVVQVQLVPERESRMRGNKTTVMSTTGSQIKCAGLQRCFITKNIFFPLFFKSPALSVTIVMCSKPEGAVHSCHQVVEDIEGGLSLRPSAYPHLLQEHCLSGHSRAGCERDSHGFPALPVFLIGPT